MKKVLVILVILVILGWTAPALAASNWFWYGSARINLGYVANSEELRAFAGGQTVNSIPGIDNTIQPTGTQSGGHGDAGTVLSSSAPLRIGAKVVASDAISGGMEIRWINADTSWRLGAAYPGDTSADIYTYKGLYFRQLYGQWKFGDGNLRVGQDYTPATFLLYSNAIGDGGLLGEENGLTTGMPYISTNPQIKLTMGGLQIALIEHWQSANYPKVMTAGAPALTGDGIDDVDFFLPRIELAYQWNSPIISLRPILAYQTYDVVFRNSGTETSKNITSYIYGLGTNLRLGPGYINIAVSGCQNGGNYGLWQYNNTYTNKAVVIDGQVKDSTGIMGMLVAGFRVNPALNVEAGYGYNKTEGQTWIPTAVNPMALGPGKAENTVQHYYIQTAITVAPGVIITPEFGAFDYGDYKNNDTGEKIKLGNSTYFLANFRIDF